MWVRVDVDFVQHPKVVAAAAHFHRGGYARVVAVWLEALTYATGHATGGFVPLNAAQHFRTDLQPVAVMNVMAGVDVRLLARFATGYQIHDYADYQMSASEVKRRRGRMPEASDSPVEKSSAARRVIHSLCKTAGPEVHIQPYMRDELPSENGRNAKNIPRSDFSTVCKPIEQDITEIQDQDQALDAPALALVETRIVRRHLLRSAHAVLDLNPEAADSELSDAVKDAAAQLRCTYDSGIVGAIVRAARAQRGSS